MRRLLGGAHTGCSAGWARPKGAAAPLGAEASFFWRGAPLFLKIWGIGGLRRPSRLRRCGPWRRRDGARAGAFGALAGAFWASFGRLLGAFQSACGRLSESFSGFFREPQESFCGALRAPSGAGADRASPLRSRGGLEKARHASPPKTPRQKKAPLSWGGNCGAKRLAGGRGFGRQRGALAPGAGAALGPRTGARARSRRLTARRISWKGPRG
jgi:hypothetical protein